MTLDDLTTPLTQAQVETSIYDVFGIVGLNTTSWKPGAVVRTLVSAVAIVIAALSSLIAAIAQGGFLELATGAWLTLVAHYVYGVDRIPASFAAGYVTLTNAGGFIFALNAGDLVVSNPASGKTYRNTAGFTLGVLGTVAVPIQADEQGAASSSGAGLITQMVTTLSGVTCTNAAALVGTDEETDTALRTRSQERLGALSPNGPWDAYAYAARTATRTDGSAIGVTRVRVVADGYGGVTTYVATASGVVTSPDVAVIDTAIQQGAAPLAVTATTLSASALVVPVTYAATLYNTSGRTAQQIQDTVAAALIAYFAAQPIGGNVAPPSAGAVYREALSAVIIGAVPEIFHVTLTLPIGDVALSVSDVPVAGTITGTLTQVPPPDGGR